MSPTVCSPCLINEVAAGIIITVLRGSLSPVAHDLLHNRIIDQLAASCDLEVAQGEGANLNKYRSCVHQLHMI